MHVCNVCTKAFTVKRSLTRHMKLHSEVKETFKCDQCDKTFSRRDRLKCHIKVHHSNNVVTDEVFNCKKCNKSFTKNSNMHRHMLICKVHQQEREVLPQSSTQKFEKDQNSIHNNTPETSLVKLMDDSKIEFVVDSISQQQNDLPQLMNDDSFEFDVDVIPTMGSLQCFYCEKVFTRKDNCKFHQKHCKKRKYPNVTSSNKRRKVQVGHGSQHDLPQLISSALDGTVKTFRKSFDYGESAIDHIVALGEMLLDFVQLIKSESEQQDIKCFFSLNLTFHQASDETDITDPAVTLRSKVFIVQQSSTDLEQKVNAAMEEIKELIDEFERNGSGWVLHQLQYLDLGKIFL